MSIYRSLAECYDQLNSSVGYEKWVDYLESHFRRCGKKIHSIIDLACGTGTISGIFAERGYEVVGVDASSEMLAQAVRKTDGMENRPVFIQQNIVELDLYGTADAAVCCLDSVNYILNPDDLQKCFARIALFINPGGIFIFDINTKAKFQRLSGHCFVDEAEGVFCSWRAFYSEKQRRSAFEMDLFFEQDGVWHRTQEDHIEREYSPEELRIMLSKAGFEKIKTFGELRLRRPGEDEDRIFFTAIRKDYTQHDGSCSQSRDG